MTDENANIRVEITDALELHCFRLVLTPRFQECLNCLGTSVVVDSLQTPVPVPYRCPVCQGSGKLAVPGSGIEILLHARSLVHLINQASLALCDWQAQTSAYLIRHLTGAAKE